MTDGWGGTSLLGDGGSAGISTDNVIEGWGGVEASR